VFVAEEHRQVVATCYRRANNRGGGAHVGDCGYEAHANGFCAMQVNFVIISNERAVRLGQSMGFEIVGTLSSVLAHPTRGLVDRFVMYRKI
jgi:hypothetical protein